MSLKIGNKTTSALLLLAVCLFMTVVTMTGFSDRSPEIALMLYLFGMLLFLLVASSRVLKNLNDIFIFWGSFIVKIVYAFYRFPFSEITKPVLAGDAGGFWRTASQYYQGNFKRIYTSFPYVLSFEFRIFGKNVLCCCLTNTVLSMIMVLLVAEIMNRFGIEGKSRLFAVALSALLPYGIQVCNSILREAIYFAFITASFFAYIKYLQTRKAVNVFVAILLLIPVLFLHIGYFPIAAVYLIDLFAHEKIKTRRDLLNRILIIAAFTVFVILTSRLNSVGYLTSGNGIEGIIAKISGANSEEYMGEAGSRYLAGIKITSLPTFVLYAPIKWFYYMFSPLPNNWRGLMDVFVFLVDGLVHFLFVWSSIACIRRIKRNNSDGHLDKLLRIVRTGFWAVVLCGFIFGLGTSTAGTAIRHRDVLIGIEAVLVGFSVYTRTGGFLSPDNAAAAADDGAPASDIDEPAADNESVAL